MLLRVWALATSILFASATASAGTTVQGHVYTADYATPHAGVSVDVFTGCPGNIPCRSHKKVTTDVNGLYRATDGLSGGAYLHAYFLAGQQNYVGQEQLLQ